MNDSIQVDGVHFVKGTLNGKSQEEFNEHEKHHGLSTEALKDVYSRLQKFEKAPEEKEQKEIGSTLKSKEIGK